MLGVTVALSWVTAHPEIDQQIADASVQIEADPRNAQLYIRRGELHRIHRQWRAAEKDYRFARKLQPDLAVVDYFIGNLRLEMDRPRQAKKRLDRFLEQQPDHAKARIARARAWVSLGRPLEAAADYSRAIDAYGADQRPDPAHYLGRARALVDAGSEHVDEAVRGLDEGLERLGRPVTLQLYAIELEAGRGRHDAALARLDQIASQADRKETWLVRRGEILESAGRDDEARDAYAAALEAIASLPATRRGNRAMHRLHAQAEASLERLAASPGSQSADPDD
jgi:tetratricopeptide (TPR) repeat protein